MNLEFSSHPWCQEHVNWLPSTFVLIGHLHETNFMMKVWEQKYHHSKKKIWENSVVAKLLLSSWGRYWKSWFSKFGWHDDGCFTYWTEYRLWSMFPLGCCANCWTWLILKTCLFTQVSVTFYKDQNSPQSIILLHIESIYDGTCTHLFLKYMRFTVPSGRHGWWCEMTI